MFTASTHIRVRYSETDQMGYVYYGNYGAYFEVGRAEAIRQLGFTYKELEAMGLVMVVAEMNCKHIRPILYDDLISVRTTLKEMPNTSATFHVEIFSQTEQLLTVGMVRLVFFDPIRKSKTHMPEVMSIKLTPYFNK